MEEAQNKASESAQNPTDSLPKGDIPKTKTEYPPSKPKETPTKPATSPMPPTIPPTLLKFPSPPQVPSFSLPQLSSSCSILPPPLSHILPKTQPLASVRSLKEASFSGEKTTSGEKIKGKITFENGAEYEGRFKGNLEEFRGKMKFANGDEYVGIWKNGNFDGKGRYLWKNGDMYFGEFKEGKIEGMGVIRYVNSDIYEGEFKNNMKHGAGVYHEQATGAEYNGEFVEDLYNGLSIWENDTLVYTGDFSEGKMHGKGKETFKRGEGDYVVEVIGEFKEGKCEGECELTHKSGLYYKGTLSENKKTGNGILVWPRKEEDNSMQKYEGEFKEDKIVFGVLLWGNNDKPNRYKGQFSDGKINGQGILTFPFFSYKGSFSDGYFSGQGTLQTEKFHLRGRIFAK